VRDLPTGRVTFLFTDIEGSTRLLHELGDAYAEALSEHRRVLREAFARFGGVEVDTQGDAFFVAFADAGQAVAAATACQAALADEPIRVRMGLHTGTPRPTGEGYVGLDVHLGARIAAAGHGGQVLLSKATRDLLPEAVVCELGEHRLKDFDEPVSIFQLGDDAFPPLTTISNTNLPRPASSFVGREREVGEVVAVIRNGARLLTLSGPGGSGKTRLAIEAASELVGEFRNGVFWVGLATVRNPALVLPTVANAIGAQDSLADHIQEKELLLLLDNLEQVVAVAPDLAALVEACPGLRLLVTSRELLRVRGEVEYEVLPLADPDAIELFAARSQSPRSGSVEELCRRLDNMPLAIELAAARTKALSPEQILERLSQRLDLFKGGRDADPRQQTLRATIEWSHDLLSTEERLLFRRLAVFVGGCRLEAAEQVAGADLDTLQLLVEKSLLRHTDGRFWMLETIREYALERLQDSGEADELRRKHADFFLALAVSANLDVEGMDAGQRFELVEPEADNLHGAIDWALPAGETTLAASLAVALEQYWVPRNPHEGRRRMDQVLDREGELPPLLHARVLRVRGGMSYIVGDYEEGTRWHEASLEEFRRLGDDAAAGHMLFRLAIEAHRSGDRAQARALCEEALGLDRSASGRAQALGTLANIAFDEGEHEEALELLEACAKLTGEVGNRWLQSHALLTRGEYALTLGRLDEGRRGIREGLAIARSIRDRQWTVWGVTLAAWAAAEEGRLFDAGRLWGALRAESERTPIGQWEGERDTWAGHIVRAAPEFEQGVLEGHRLAFEDAVEHALSVDSPA
jgi:predicted ATPase